MDFEMNKAWQEIYLILEVLDKKLVEKIPIKVMGFIENQRDKNYYKEIKKNVPVEEQNLLADTYNILAILKIKYWCKDKQEKKKIIDIINRNERKLQKEYNTNIF